MKDQQMRYSITLEDEYGNKVRGSLEDVWTHEQFKDMAASAVMWLGIILEERQQFTQGHLA